MISIGIRVTYNEIHYSIVKYDNNIHTTLSISKLKVPKALDNPCKLSFLRNTFETIIKQYKINRAGIKLIEGNARLTHNANTFFRFNIEGVLLELFSNSSIEKYILGLASNIASALEIQSKPVKDMVQDLGIDDSITTDEKKKLTDEDKEALVVAIAALAI
ncbi:hypothetical protein ACN077_20565 [Clostridium chromiireducens]|uniref:hypothetical protein n=1 Tax=Clostridium chromiireducens TaxID=225345 RepID=UPI003AF7CF35